MFSPNSNQVILLFSYQTGKVWKDYAFIYKSLEKREDIHQNVTPLSLEVMANFKIELYIYLPILNIFSEGLDNLVNVVFQ